MLKPNGHIPDSLSHLLNFWAGSALTPVTWVAWELQTAVSMALLSFALSLLIRWDFFLYLDPGLRQVSRTGAGHHFPSWKSPFSLFFPWGYFLAFLPHLWCVQQCYLPAVWSNDIYPSAQTHLSSGSGIGVTTGFCYQPSGSSKQLSSPLWTIHPLIKKRGLKEMDLEIGATKNPHLEVFKDSCHLQEETHPPHYGSQSLS